MECNKQSLNDKGLCLQTIQHVVFEECIDLVGGLDSQGKAQREHFNLESVQKALSPPPNGARKLSCCSVEEAGCSRALKCVLVCATHLLNTKWILRHRSAPRVLHTAEPLHDGETVRLQLEGFTLLQVSGAVDQT